MVERLCSNYGTPLPILVTDPPAADITPLQPVAAAAAQTAADGGSSSGGLEAAAGRKRSLAAAFEAAAAGDEEQARQLSDRAGAEGIVMAARVDNSQQDENAQPGTPAAAAAPQPAAGDSPAARQPRKRGGAQSGGGTSSSGTKNAGTAASSSPSSSSAAAGVSGSGGVYYAFPSLAQLAAATEDELRALGFGYRAKFITGAARVLHEKDGGGDAWLMALRTATAAEAAAALEELPGVGPKVAACVALFSLDKADAIPVDTHVWQLAIK
jgi:3-methyladenine DNA glycosylase/8-oxoguanine DNA glycosylase